MEVLYIPQLDGDDAGESPTAGRYRLLKRVPEENAPEHFEGEIAEGDGEAAHKRARATFWNRSRFSSSCIISYEPRPTRKDRVQQPEGPAPRR